MATCDPGQPKRAATAASGALGSKAIGLSAVRNRSMSAAEFPTAIDVAGLGVSLPVRAVRMRVLTPGTPLARVTAPV